MGTCEKPDKSSSSPLLILIPPSTASFSEPFKWEVTYFKAKYISVLSKTYWCQGQEKIFTSENAEPWYSSHRKGYLYKKIEACMNMISITIFFFSTQKTNSCFCFGLENFVFRYPFCSNFSRRQIPYQKPWRVNAKILSLWGENNKAINSGSVDEGRTMVLWN